MAIYITKKYVVKRNSLADTVCSECGLIRTYTLARLRKTEDCSCKGALYFTMTLGGQTVTLPPPLKASVLKHPQMLCKGHIRSYYLQYRRDYDLIDWNFLLEAAETYQAENELLPEQQATPNLVAIPLTTTLPMPEPQEPKTLGERLARVRPLPKLETLDVDIGF